MSRITTSPSEALAQLIAECKQLDASEVGERWNQFNGAIAVAEMVLRDYVEPAPVAWASFADNGNIRIWSQEPLVTFGFKTQPLYAVPVAAQPAAAPAKKHQVAYNIDLVAAAHGRVKNYYDPCDAASGDIWTIVGAIPYMIADLKELRAAPLHESGSAAAGQDSHFRNVLANVCEGWNISPDLRKYLETELFSAPAIAAPTEVERDAKRWRYSMDFQRKAGAPIPKAMTEMWRKVIDDNRTFPTVEEYEAATDAAIDAAIATGEKAK